MKQMTIPIEEWIKLVESGIDTPATVVPKGNSMWPLIRGGKDILEVIPVKHSEDTTVIRAQIKEGDIVIFKRADGTFVVHRIWRFTPSDHCEIMLQTYGDNCQKPDEPVPLDAVYGIVTKIHRGDKELNPSSNMMVAIGTTNRSLVQVRHQIAGLVHNSSKGSK